MPSGTCPVLVTPSGLGCPAMMNNRWVSDDQGKTANPRSLRLPSYPTAFPTSPPSPDLRERDVARYPGLTRWQQPLPRASLPFVSSNILVKADRLIQTLLVGGKRPLERGGRRLSAIRGWVLGGGQRPAHSPHPAGLASLHGAGSQLLHHCQEQSHPLGGALAPHPHI